MEESVETPAAAESAPADPEPTKEAETPVEPAPAEPAPTEEAKGIKNVVLCIENY